MGRAFLSLFLLWFAVCSREHPLIRQKSSSTEVVPSKERHLVGHWIFGALISSNYPVVFNQGDCRWKKKCKSGKMTETTIDALVFVVECIRLLTSVARNILRSALYCTCSSNESQKEKLEAFCHAGQHWVLTQLVPCIWVLLSLFLSRPFIVRGALQTVHICYISPEHCICTKFKTEQQHFSSILLKITLLKYD